MSTDDLAVIRTHLANERTVLAYLRTSLAFLATGAGLIHFIPSIFPALAGWVFIVIGGCLLMAGIIRFIHVKRRIK